ncbi:anti-sigma regulatory factor (Ser/Thr protein kinase) [Amycolatopsis sulphurea]|uniref:Anti-sigma regulatory factor (Ser/Thr protein kinase) n=1 Tax=Amycolatopsis sulphurea TaxID=76022 RepID=A0A2A9FZE4_9PSEU|nr:ATP-binding protein [Amycolatopsis sulphurea]PFG56794.1 anti-sigma regulatory factor (Ser/Thr protein kinase) [Amycolatopsis sulphurea]
MPVPSAIDVLSLHGVPAEPLALRSLRHRLLEWALSAGIPVDRAHDIVLAGYEALANVADHAYREGEPGHVDLDATLHVDQVELVITDHGCWRPAGEDRTPVPVRGRGLLLLHASADRADVRTGAGGTVVTLGWNLGDARTAEMP